MMSRCLTHHRLAAPPIAWWQHHAELGTGFSSREFAQSADGSGLQAVQSGGPMQQEQTKKEQRRGTWHPLRAHLQHLVGPGLCCTSGNGGFSGGSGCSSSLLQLLSSGLQRLLAALQLRCRLCQGSSCLLCLRTRQCNLRCSRMQRIAMAHMKDHFCPLAPECSHNAFALRYPSSRDE